MAFSFYSDTRKTTARGGASNSWSLPRTANTNRAGTRCWTARDMRAGCACGKTLTRNAVQVDQGKADPINLAPEALRHFTMGTDSFTVAREVAVAGQPTTIPFGEADIYQVVLKGKFQVLEHDRLVPSQYDGPGQYGPRHYRT